MRKRRHHVVFVAYGQKEADLWKQYLARLKEDATLKNEFDLVHWPDESSSAHKHRLRDWLSPVLRRAERLRRHLKKAPFVDADPNMDPDVTLVSMGKGCCVTQAYILHSLREDETVRYVRRIRQVIFISPARVRRYRTFMAFTILATILAFLLQMVTHFAPNPVPTEPSLIILGLLLAIFSLVFGIVSNPSAMDLLGLKPIQLDRDDLDRQFRERVLEGSKGKAGTWPIAQRELSIQDFGEDQESDVARIVQIILQPNGHKHVYEVDLLERRLTITPLPEPLPPKEIEIGVINNTAILAHKVVFAACNATSEESAIPPWELRYQSYGGKLRVQGIPNTNRWTPQERSAYQYNSDQYVFRFIPEAAHTYTLDAILWNGFSSGNRDSHMHLRADAYFKKLSMVLDLRAYLEARWQIKKTPKAYFFFGRIPNARGKDRDLEGPSCDCIKNRRILEEGSPVEVRTIEPGLYYWEVEHVRDGGILGFIFDLSPGEER